MRVYKRLSRCAYCNSEPHARWCPEVTVAPVRIHPMAPFAFVAIGVGMGLGLAIVWLVLR
jgi:hypothetical protein